MLISFYGYTDRIEPLCTGKDVSDFLRSKQYRSHFADFDSGEYKETGCWIGDRSYTEYQYEDGSPSRSMEEYCKDHGIENPSGKGMGEDWWEVWSQWCLHDDKGSTKEVTIKKALYVLDTESEISEEYFGQEDYEIMKKSIRKYKLDILFDNEEA